MIQGKFIITLEPSDVGTVVTFNAITVKRIHILGTAATVAGHQYRLEDASGNILYRTQAGGSWHESESITQRQWPQGYGVKVVSLDSGVIDIEYERHGETVY